MIRKNNSILIVANCFWYVYNFRLDLIKLLKASGYNITVIAPKDPYKDIVEKYVDEVKDWNLRRGSINPFLEIRSIWQLVNFYRKINPKLIHNFTIKPSLYGGIAGRITGQKIIISHITGIGPSFFGFSRKIRILSYLLNPIYRFSFSKNSKIIFHNKEDAEIFLEKEICKAEYQSVIEGSGVDTEKFKNNKFREKYFNPVQVLFPARIIREKGFIELFDACLDLWKEGYIFKLNIAGEIDTENKSTLTRKEITSISLNKNINFLGKIRDMKSIYSKTDIVVLPSWREGLSKSLIESASMSLPIIATNVPGCKEIIENNKSGILIPLKDKFLLKKAIKKLIKNPQLGIEYGQKARKIVKDKFELSCINKKILEIYNQLISNL